MESTGKISEALRARLNKIAKVLGPQAVQEAKGLARELAETRGGDYHAYLEAAMIFAGAVAEFRGEALPGVAHRCQICQDLGFQVVEEPGRPSGVRACPSCHNGVMKAAATWLEAVKPRNARGKRFDSDIGWKKFRDAYKHLDMLSRRIMSAMDYLEQRES